ALSYWASRKREVGFILSRGEDIVAIDVKSGRLPDNLPGIEAFSREFPLARKPLVGRDGIPLDRSSPLQRSSGLIEYSIFETRNKRQEWPAFDRIKQRRQECPTGVPLCPFLVIQL